MKNKNLIFSILWGVLFIMLFIIILIPKNENTQSILSLLTFVLIFIVPFVLIGCQTLLVIKIEDEKKYDDILLAIPNIGCCSLMLLTILKFIASLNNNGVAETIVCLLTFVSLELLIAYFIINLKKHSMKEKQKNKRYIYMQIGSYISLALYYFCLIAISIDYLLA